MGEAQEAMRRSTAAMMAGDMEALKSCYAPDVVVTTPDGELHGPGQLVDYLQQMFEAMPDLAYTLVRELEAGDAAVDEGIVTGTNTGPVTLPDGTTIPATGKQVRLRSVDIVTVSSGLVVRHDIYFDRLEMMQQLDLLGQPTTTR